MAILYLTATFLGFYEIIIISISISEMNTRISHCQFLLASPSTPTHTSDYIWNKLHESDTVFITDFLILEEYLQL